MPANTFIDKKGVLATLPKFKMIMNPKSYRMAHAVYDLNEVQTIKPYHNEPETFMDKLALNAIKLVRGSYDVLTRYNPEKMKEREWLNRILFLETVAGVPGMIGGMVRHLKSLRSLENDHGWIHHLLQEAENERMHLFIFLSIYNPGIFFRLRVAMTQLSFFNAYFFLYMVHPRFCHRFVGYLEEEAVHTYTKCLQAYDNDFLPVWKNMRPPPEAIEYYGLDPKTATMRDVILCVRADEACHRCVNHHFSDIPFYYDIEMQEIQVSYDGFRDSQ